MKRKRQIKDFELQQISLVENPINKSCLISRIIKVEQTIELTDKKIGNDARWYK